MLQMGRYEQAGSGVFNVTKYLPLYTPGAKPIFEEYHDIFSITIPLAEKEEKKHTTEIKSGQKSESWPESWPESVANKILSLVFFGEKSNSELAEKLGMKPKTNSLELALRQLRKTGVLAHTIPAKPSSRLQKYRLTAKGKMLLLAACCAK